MSFLAFSTVAFPCELAALYIQHYGLKHGISQLHRNKNPAEAGFLGLVR